MDDLLFWLQLLLVAVVAIAFIIMALPIVLFLLLLALPFIVFAIVFL